MTVVALIAIGLALAAPPLRDMVQRNRVASQVATFSADLKFARAEAMQRGQSVSICPTGDGTSCLTNNGWQNGWIVFYDQNASGAIDSGDVILRRRLGWASGDTFASAPTLSAVTFGRMGLASNLAAGPFNFVARAAAASTSSTQCVLLNQVGQQTLQSGGSGSCT